jgi:exopolysaccharide production protein ExoQ
LNYKPTKLLERLEKGFVLIALLLFSGALIPLLREEPGVIADSVKGDPVMQVILVGVYGVTLVLIALRWKQFVRVAAGDKLLLLLIGIALVSVLWSAASEVTLRRSAALVGTTLFGMYLATRYSVIEVIRLLAWALGMAALLSLLFALAVPSYGIENAGLVPPWWQSEFDTRGDAWRGIYLNKNTLGRLMALSAVVFLLFALRRRRGRWIAWGSLILSVVLLLLSNSVTSLIVFLTVLILLPLFLVLRWEYTLAVPFFIVAVLVVGGVSATLLVNATTILDALGRDVTLTGRTELWAAAAEMIWQRPWLGYGYGGFWLGWEGESARIWRMTGMLLPHAHNGLFDLWLELGLLGVSVFALGFFLAFLRAVAWVRLHKAAEGLWPLVYLTFMLLSNLTESTILRQNSVFWVLYVSTILSISYKSTKLTLPLTPARSQTESGAAKRPLHGMRKR